MTKQNKAKQTPPVKDYKLIIKNLKVGTNVTVKFITPRGIFGGNAMSNTMELIIPKTFAGPGSITLRAPRTSRSIRFGVSRFDFELSGDTVIDLKKPTKSKVKKSSLAKKVTSKKKTIAQSKANKVNLTKAKKSIKKKPVVNKLRSKVQKKKGSASDSWWDKVK